MSSPSQIAGPGARLSVLRGTASLATQPGRTYKAFGQDYQFAERMSNPFPEFIVHDPEPAPVGAATASVHGIAENEAGQVDGADDRTASSDVPLDRFSSSKESPMRESVWTPPPSQPWYKKVKKFWWLTLVITLLGILGVLLAILGAMGMLGNHRYAPLLVVFRFLLMVSRPSAPDSPSSTGNATATSTTSPPSSTTSTSPLPTVSTPPSLLNILANCTSPDHKRQLCGQLHLHQQHPLDWSGTQHVQ